MQSAEVTTSADADGEGISDLNAMRLRREPLAEASTIAAVTGQFRVSLAELGLQTGALLDINDDDGAGRKSKCTWTGQSGLDNGQCDA